MNENMKAFLDAIGNNEDLKKKFDEISSKEQSEQKDYTDEYIALAKDCGITLTKDDFEFDEQELSDEDLENVSGGILVPLCMAEDLYKRWKESEKAKAKASSGQGSGATGE